MKSRIVEKILIKNGFAFIEHKTHGAFYKHIDGRATTVGKHYKKDEIPLGTLRKISKQTGIQFN